MNSDKDFSRKEVVLLGIGILTPLVFLCVHLWNYLSQRPDFWERYFVNLGVMCLIEIPVLFMLYRDRRCAERRGGAK